MRFPMVTLFLSAGVFLAGFASTQAHASFVNTDWKVAGDRQAVLDTESGLEWLSLDVTRHWTISEALAETARGGTLEGWRLPSFSEVEQMISSFYVGTGVNVYGSRQNNFNNSTGLAQEQKARDLQFRDLFAEASLDPIPTIGAFYRDDGTVGYSGSYALARWAGSAFFGFSTPFSAVQDWTSVFLVSDGGVTLSSINDPFLNANNPNAPINNVSAPASLSAAGLLMLCLFRRRSVRRNT